MFGVPNLEGNYTENPPAELGQIFARLKRLSTFRTW